MKKNLVSRLYSFIILAIGLYQTNLIAYSETARQLPSKLTI
ncbi:MAG: hypothetical protein RMJ00_04960 [Nitrososphaerota archaeon]|nr:hypothetical protein [Nitrososphaerota archaeon]